MALIPSIILSGRQPNPLGAMAQGTQLAAATNAVQDQNALRALYQQQGPGIMQGDPQALNALAGVDPMAALSVQNTRSQMSERQERLRMAREQSARAVAQAAQQMSMAERQAEQQQMQQAMQQAQFLAQRGQVVQAAAILSEAAGQQVPPDPEAIEMAIAAMDGGLAAISGLNEMFPEPKEPDGVRTLRLRAQEAGLQPDTPEYQAFMQSGGRQPDQVNVNVGGDTRPQIGTIPQGYQVIQDPESGAYRMEPVPGGPAEREIREGEQKTGARQEQQTLKLSNNLERVFLNLKALEGGMPELGVGGAILGRIPGTSAADFRSRQEAINTSAALGEVQNMRDNSPTGGAVGSLTDGEREAIGQSITALNTSTSVEEYQRAANAYINLSLDLAHGEGNWSLDPRTGEVRLKQQSSGATQQAQPNADNVTWEYDLESGLLRSTDGALEMDLATGQIRSLR